MAIDGNRHVKKPTQPEARKLRAGIIRKPKTITPLESQEAEFLARWLTLRRIIFTHVPNEIRARHPGYLRKRARQGVQTGFPDYLIFTRTGGVEIGVALELKRVGGAKPRPEQRDWLDRLSALGWHTLVAYGAADAIDQLKALGY